MKINLLTTHHTTMELPFSYAVVYIQMNKMFRSISDDHFPIWSDTCLRQPNMKMTPDLCDRLSQGFSGLPRENLRIAVYAR